jgi:hypothetical protein
MALNARSLTLFNSAPWGTAGNTVNFYNYSTPDAAATVLTAGYFNDVRDKLKVNDVIMAVCLAHASNPTGDIVQMRVTAAPTSGNVTVAAEGDAASAPREVVPTADGLTTGLITAGDTAVSSTSANSAHILTLPAIADVPLNHKVAIFNGATACELRTPAASNTKINNVDADGSQQMAVPASSMSVATKILADNWMVECYVAAGTRTIPTPD